MSSRIILQFACLCISLKLQPVETQIIDLPGSDGGVFEYNSTLRSNDLNTRRRIKREVCSHENCEKPTCKCSLKEHSVTNPEQQLKCVGIGNSRFVWMLFSCPNTTLGNKLRATCQTVDSRNRDPILHVPIYSSKTQFTYRNIDCARCNLQEKEFLTPYLVNVDFGDYGTCNIDYLMNGTTEETLQYAMDRCSVAYEVPLELKTTWPCIMSSNAEIGISKHIVEMSESIVCQEHAPRQVLDIIFIDVRCFSCDRYLSHPNDTCLDKSAIVTTPFKSMRVMLDISLYREEFSEEHDNSLCDGVYDPIFEICRRGMCGYKYTVKNGECAPVNVMQRLQNVPVKLTIYALISQFTKSIGDLDYIFHTLNKLVQSSIKIEDIKIRNYEGRTPLSYTKCRVRAIDFHLFLSWVDENKENMFAFLNELAQLKWRSDDNNFQQVNVTEVCQSCQVNTIDINCQSGKQIETMSPYLDGMLSNKSLIKCAYIEITIHEIVKLSEYYDQFKQLLSNTYTLNNNLKICYNTFKSYLKSSFKEFESGFSHAESIVTFVCFAVSCISLVMFLILKTKSTNSRKTHGKNTIALAISLLCAQIMFMGGAGVTEFPSVCMIVAIVLHFSWLHVFMWMSICCYHISKNIGLISASRDNGCRAFFHYCACSIVIPLLLVTSLTMIHLIDVDEYANIRYGGPVCFLSSVNSILAGFLVPVLVMLCFNIYCMIKFFKYIKNHTNIMNEANIKQNRSYLLVYLRMSHLFGFSWIVGIVAQFVQYEIMWYIFSVLNGLQGLFLVLSLTLNSNVVRSIQKCFNK